MPPRWVPESRDERGVAGERDAPGGGLMDLGDMDLGDLGNLGDLTDHRPLITDQRKNGRGERIRTSDSCVPNAVLYQAELHPDAE
jgi:hypothetical protein